MKKRARGRDGTEGGERRDGSQEGGRGKGVVREEERKEWRRGKRERRSGKEGWAVEGEEGQGGEGRDWHEKTWEGVKRNVKKTCLSGDTGKYGREVRVCHSAWREEKRYRCQREGEKFGDLVTK